MEPEGDLRGKKILDIGCGLGGKTIAYGEAGASAVFGTDILTRHVSESISYAERMAGEFRWAFFVSDAARLPIPDGAFDTVVANDAMEHFAEPERTLSEMVRVTRRGGAIWIFFTPHFSPLGSHLYDYVYIPWCHLLFRRKDIRRAIERILASRQAGAPAEEIASETDKIMESYERDLNRMTVRRFMTMLKRQSWLDIKYRELKPAKFSFLKVFTGIPLLRELFTGTVIYRLERRE
jgi:ubiquinone/menaquinone biosynthesis C-methylase UbiE